MPHSAQYSTTTQRNSLFDNTTLTKMVFLTTLAELFLKLLTFYILEAFACHATLSNQQSS